MFSSVFPVKSLELLVRRDVYIVSFYVIAIQEHCLSSVFFKHNFQTISLEENKIKLVIILADAILRDIFTVHYFYDNIWFCFRFC